MFKVIKGLFSILLAVGFIAQSVAAEEPNISNPNQCAEKRAQIITSFESAVERYQSLFQEKAGRAENIKNHKLETIGEKVTRLTALAEKKFVACLERTDNEPRCLELKEGALAQIAAYAERMETKIEKWFEQILARLESWLEKRVASAENRKNLALRKLEERCGTHPVPTIGDSVQ